MHRANEATEKYRSPREDDFSAAERASAAGADGQEDATDKVKIVPTGNSKRKTSLRQYFEIEIAV